MTERKGSSKKTTNRIGGDYIDLFSNWLVGQLKYY